MPACAAKGQGKYYPKLQWHTSSSTHFTVRANPKKVTEYFYNAVDSLMKTSLPKFGSYDEFIYDSAGNQISRKVFFNENWWSLLITRFSATGSSSEFEYKSKTGIKKGILAKVEPAVNSRYKETIYTDKAVSRVIYYTYKNNGDEVITAETQKLDNHSNTTTRKYLYKSNQLLSLVTKVVSGRGDISVEKKRFYYGKDNTFDSIIAQSPNEIRRLLFTKNKFGDPITEIDIRNNDTMRYTTNIYLYDEKGNWIRRVEEEHIEDKWNSPAAKFAMIRREIIY